VSEPKHGIGVIGPGVIWDRGHWPAIQQLENVAVEAVYDIDDERKHEVAAETDATPVDDVDTIFVDDTIDIVALLTPPFARVDYVKQACEAGNHLMAEKPLARTLEDALTIHDAVHDSGVECFVPFGRTSSATMTKAIEIINSGLLGEPRVFSHSSLSTPYSWVPLDHWMHTMEQSGGPIFDYSIHFIDFARACMNAEAEAVSYAGRATTGRVDSDDHATLSIFYGNDALGEFTKSWAYPPGVDRWNQGTEIICKEGVVVLADDLTVHTPDGTWTSGADENQEGRVRTYRNLIAGIEEGDSLLADETDGLRAIEILDAALTSRERGERVPVELHHT
jgi:predicted dehydrogenase